MVKMLKPMTQEEFYRAKGQEENIKILYYSKPITVVHTSYEEYLKFFIQFYETERTE